MGGIVDFSYKNEKFGKRKQKLFDELKKSDPELSKILEDFRLWRLTESKTKTQIRIICRELEKKVKKLDKRYSKRIKELGFKIETVSDSNYDVEFKGW